MNGESLSVESCYDEWSASYFEEYYGADAPYPPVHVALIEQMLAAHGTKSVLDAGCGPASILRTLAGRGFDCWGFDVSPGMVAEAQAAMADLQLPRRIWQGDASQATSYSSEEPGAPQRFDAAMVIGVLPHLTPAQVYATFENLRNAVRPGGLVIVQARNALFSLFTMNRNTHEFVRDELLASDEARSERELAFVEESLDRLADRLRMDLPMNRGGAGYDDTQPRAENPLVLPDTFAACGFRGVETLFYHYHAVPPMCESVDAATFRAMSVAMERTCGPRDWRGHFMASSFLLTGIRR